MKKDYMKPAFDTRAYLQNVAIGANEEDELASMSLGDNDVEFDW